MPEFPYSRLRRWPDVEAENLQAYDATDLLLVGRARDSGVDGSDIAVIGDEYGAITLALVHAGLRGIRVHQDLATGRRALARNAQELGLVSTPGEGEGDGAARPLRGASAAPEPGRGEDDGAAHRLRGAHGAPEATDLPFVPHELDEALLRGARLVLLQLPKALAELEEIADAVARWAAPDVVLVAGGRVKHMTLAQNEVLARRFAHVQPQRAERKSRLVVASSPLPVPVAPPFPVREQHDGLTLVAHGGAFAGARLDIGTRVLRDVLAVDGSQLRRNGRVRADSSPYRPENADSSGVVNGEGRRVLDLGCGTGALAVTWALAHPGDAVTATDRSAAAVASARATVDANGVADRVAVTHDDAGSALPDGSFDTVLLNPPFHLGSSVHTGAATRLFEAAARLLRPGGELLAVYNSSLGYRPELTRLIGRTEQLRRTPKFTVTRSVRRP
ncbi:class I SAM-dependent methyltransferase [Microbacterium sp. p3-SID336]|uniref:class I SAM-dependent methyltransferase n=1 Tax=Microbacterium sp. p3-SID336 TaxID=2916212 RepID=UPI0021A64B8C|nr:class I SAM-dependent methyltransferase [Microbacterium sp. p3-SID336]MCT1477169.1 class I SAM-dependent methyltransferase [Microbacterium sp. p3-SID336]